MRVLLKDVALAFVFSVLVFSLIAAVIASDHAKTTFEQRWSPVVGLPAAVLMPRPLPMQLRLRYTGLHCIWGACREV